MDIAVARIQCLPKVGLIPCGRENWLLALGFMDRLDWSGLRRGGVLDRCANLFDPIRFGWIGLRYPNQEERNPTFLFIAQKVRNARIADDSSFLDASRTYREIDCKH